MTSILIKVTAEVHQKFNTSDVLPTPTNQTQCQESTKEQSHDEVAKLADKMTICALHCDRSKNGYHPAATQVNPVIR